MILVIAAALFGFAYLLEAKETDRRRRARISERLESLIYPFSDAPALAEPRCVRD